MKFLQGALGLPISVIYPKFFGIDGTLLNILSASGSGRDGSTDGRVNDRLKMVFYQNLEFE